MSVRPRDVPRLAARATGGRVACHAGMRTIWLIAISTLAACMHSGDADEQTLRADRLMQQYEAIERRHPQERAADPAGGCDAAALADRALDEALRGNHAAAVPLYRASLACEASPAVALHAFFLACQAQDTAQAQVFYHQIADDPRRDLLRQACISYGVASLP